MDILNKIIILSNNVRNEIIEIPLKIMNKKSRSSVSGLIVCILENKKGKTYIYYHSI